MKKRTITQFFKGMPTEDGAGVRLLRILGQPAIGHFDPFLLLDEFKSQDSQDYIAGFPPHPHRGFETVTYMKNGRFRHKDSKGNSGLLEDGSVQWMTAGKGIIHSEMPEMSQGLLWGFQLWINLPARLKMIDPSYQDLGPSQLPVFDSTQLSVKVLAGAYQGLQSQARTLVPFEYYDVGLKQPGVIFETNTAVEHNVMIYVYEGSVEDANGKVVAAGNLALVDGGDIAYFKATSASTAFLFFSAQKLNEPIVRGGPFVMNTAEELQNAFQDFRNGTLGKYR